MDGFKDTTRTIHTMGPKAKGHGGAAKISRVMSEFKSGTLHSGSDRGPKVSNPRQAIAIAISESKRHPMK